MHNFTFRILLLMLPVFACSQNQKALIPKTNTVFYELGDDNIRIRILQYGDSKDLFFINLHDDEVTAVSGATKLLEKHGGTLVKIENDRNRNIRFKLNGRYYAFDPNRIFSRTGIIQTLRTFGPISNKAIEELDKFAKRILQLLPSSPTCVISLHNNYNGKFSVTSYVRGNEREKDARQVRYKSTQDPDDLFLTTDSLLFQSLSKEKFNIVWQDNQNAYKDGSLSVYCGQRNICYLNCETEHGRLNQYSEMISAAVKHIRKIPAPDSYAVQTTTPSPPSQELPTTTYKYQLASSPDNYEVYFGEKKIGMTRPLEKNAAQSNHAGQMDISSSFTVYDNMDFFLVAAGGSAKRKIELRVDPTRSRKLVDPAKATIQIKVAN